MLTLPDAIVALLVPFATLFTSPTWRKAQLLLIGAILTPGQRTVAAALRVMGRSDQRDYARYHEVLNRAVWSSRQAARILLVLLLQHLDRGDGPLIFGIDRPIAAPRSGRGPSTATRCVPAGLRWSRPAACAISPGPRALGRTPLGLAGAHGAGAFAVTTNSRDASTRSSPWARQSCNCAAGCPTDPWCWWATTAMPCNCCQSLREPVTLIARLRLTPPCMRQRHPVSRARMVPLKGPRRPPLKVFLEQTDVTWASAEVAWYDGITRAVELTSQTAVWYRSGKPPVLIRWVLIRDPQGSFATQALLCTDPAADPTQILEWFVLRWQLEVTFHEVRTHLGVETQRQWSDLAIARTTPALLGLFSWTTLAAHALQKRHPMTQRKAAWYDKPSPTFVDAIALARRHLWLASEGFSLSVADPDIQELPVALYHRLVDSLAYAA